MHIHLFKTPLILSASLKRNCIVKKTMAVIKVIEIMSSSEKSWEDAKRTVVKTEGNVVYLRKINYPAASGRGIKIQPRKPISPCSVAKSHESGASDKQRRIDPITIRFATGITRLPAGRFGLQFSACLPARQVRQ
jgi:hypothetical protein